MLIRIKAKTNKYAAIKTPCRLGHRHDSKAEARYCDQLHLIKKSGGPILDIRTQVRFNLIVNGVRVGWHTVDFLIKHPDQTVEVREVKGYRVRDFSLRMRLFKALYPQITYTVIK